MRDTAERIRLVRLRAGELRRKRENRFLSGLSSLCAALAVALMGAFGTMAGSARGGTAPSFYGAMLLSDDTGGYALVGVLSFMAGVVVTVLCFRCGRKSENHLNKNKEYDNK